MNEKTVKSTRVTRKPLAQRGPQSIAGSKDPDFEYRFVNDTGSRIENFKQAGYELVTTDELTVGDARVFDNTDLGSTKRVVSNDGTTSYLMRIKKEWYQEDQKSKADLLAEQEKAMTKEASSDYGSIKLTRDK